MTLTRTLTSALTPIMGPNPNPNCRGKALAAGHKLPGSQRLRGSLVAGGRLSVWQLTASAGPACLSGQANPVRRRAGYVRSHRTRGLSKGDAVTQFFVDLAVNSLFT